jgi:hypothetical protein
VLTKTGTGKTFSALGRWNVQRSAPHIVTKSFSKLKFGILGRNSVQLQVFLHDHRKGPQRTLRAFSVCFKGSCYKIA